MNKYQQKAEVWETQVWIMWILAFLLYEANHMFLFWIVLVWSIISFIGVNIYALIGKIEEAKEKLLPTVDK